MKISKVIILVSSIVLLAFSGMTAQAATSYSSDGKYYPEGYIIVGENHAFNSAVSMASYIDPLTCRVKNATNVFYKPTLETNFSMSGNLYYVFEGNTAAEIAVQASKEYIYSDGLGNHGAAVTKIHQIIESNPSVDHWNIIAWHGEESAKLGKDVANYYINSYANWINYEFVGSSVYVLSLPTKGCYADNTLSKVNEFQSALKSALPNYYLDYTDYYNSMANELKPNYLFTPEGYQMIQTDVIKKVRQNRIKSFMPWEVGIIICSECHAGSLLESRISYFEDTELTPILPKDNITSLNSKDIMRPAYWGGGDTVIFCNKKFEAFSEINREMALRPNIKFWYIVFWVGTNDVRYQGLTSAIDYMKTNIQKIEANDFYAEHTIALMTTPHIYGRGKSTIRLIDNYDDAEIEFMKEIGYEDYIYDVRPSLDSYIVNGVLQRFEYDDYNFSASGDGVHYYGKQLWYTSIDACDTIYNNSMGYYK